MGRKHLQCSVLYSFVITFYKNTKNLKGEQPSETTFQRIFKNKPAHKKYHQKIILKTDAKLFMKIQPTTCLDITLSLKESVDMLLSFLGCHTSLPGYGLLGSLPICCIPAKVTHYILPHLTKTQTLHLSLFRVSIVFLLTKTIGMIPEIQNSNKTHKLSL